jgi:hypothetical protein
MLYFTSVIYLLLTETNRYYHQHLDRHDRTPNPLPDIMNPEMFLFLAIIVRIGHNICDRLRGYQTRTEQFFSPFYQNTMTRDHFWHISLHYLHFTDNDTKLNMNDKNYDRPWKISLWNTQYCILKILQSFWTFGTWPGDYTFPREGCIQVVYPKEPLTFRN